MCPPTSPIRVRLRLTLPLGGQEFQSTQLNPPLLALEDALPDIWGRRLLVLRHGLARGQQSEPHLMRALGGGGSGRARLRAAGRAARDARS